MAPRKTDPRQKANGRERPNARGEATRLEILRKAEELFAERGISVVPLRDIGKAAGQKNNVAVQYHFGDRENLVREISRHQAAASEQRRADLLARLLARSEPATVRDLVDIFIQSLACHLSEDNHYLAFLSQHVVARGGYAGQESLHDGGTYDTLLALLRHLLPDHPPELLEERWMMMTTSAVHTLAQHQTAERAGAPRGDVDALLDELVSFLSAGVAAPTSTPRADARALDG